MTLSLSPSKRRLRRRIHQLPSATHDCVLFGIWIRKGGRLVCRTCGKP